MTRLPSLYAILDTELIAARGLAPERVFDAWLGAGVRLVQLRAKRMAAGSMLALAETLASRAEAAGATFIVNDRVDVALLCGAAGVHVGQTDLAPVDVRGIVGPAVMVGLSTHDEIQVQAAVRQPISYLAIGPVFATSSKVHPDPIVGVETVRRVAASVARSHLPLVAIGGITLQRAREVIEAGAASVAIVSDLLVGDPKDRASAFLDVLGERAER